ncbi:golgin subfamily A member 6-like protein 22 isoform X2 [Anneissia japonica]|uniref:golgin subfamily A member 6-like protein 22 isoform X2 n=1 Tax=Anneissia japonica TaxID=1529436 RepID=UPI0014256F35|nr:golgin subfamily A member 6-like protein 22 isoform X2 [Anneissia japonica]
MWPYGGGVGGGFDSHRQSQIQNRFQPLPSIQGGHAPQTGFEKALVPVGTGRLKPQMSHIANGGPMMLNDVGDAKVRQFDNRLSVAEQSNRALLEEVVRLQGELKQAHRKTEDMLAVERQARQQLTENIRASNDLIGQLGARLKRAEEKVAEERSAVGALVNHTKQVEQAVLGSQQELVAKRDHQMTKFHELRNDVDEANRMREQLERAMTSMVDEIRQLKSKADSQSLEFSSVMHEVKERSKRLEEDSRQARMENQRKYHDNHHLAEQATSVLRTQLDARLGEVRDVLMDLRNRVTTEETERRQQEQQVFLKMNDLQAQVHEQNRKREEAMHVFDVVQRERDHSADNERLKLQSKIAEIAEEVSKKILGKEIRLREEAQQKFGNIEKYLHEEQSARIAHEQAMREENEKRWTALQKLTEEEVLHVRENQKKFPNIMGSVEQMEMMDKIEKMEKTLLKRRESSDDLAEFTEDQKRVTKHLKTQLNDMSDKIENLEIAMKKRGKTVDSEDEKYATKTMKSRLGEISDKVEHLEKVTKKLERTASSDDERTQRAMQRKQSISRRTSELDRHKNAGGLTKVGDTMERLEKMQAETKKQLEQVMKAEIKSRQNQDKQIETKIEDVQEKLGVAISTLQQAIGGINEQVMTATNDYQDKLKMMLEEYKGADTRGVADLDAKVNALQSKINLQDEHSEAQIAKVLAKVMDDDSKEEAKKSLRKHQTMIEEIEDWKAGADRKLKQIKEKMDDLEPEIERMNKANESMQEDMNRLVENEQKERIRDVQMVRADLDAKYKQIQTDMTAAKAAVMSAGGATTPMPAIPISQKEKMAAGKGGGKVDQGTLDKMSYLETEVNKYRGKFMEMKEEISKVDGTVNTVKLHLSRKIEKEEKQRKEETQDLQYILEDVKKKVEKLDKGGVKPDKKDKDKDKHKSDEGDDKKKKKKSDKGSESEKKDEGDKDDAKKDGEEGGEKKKKKKDKDKDKDKEGEGKKEKKKSKDDKENGEEGKEKKEKKEKKKDKEKDGEKKKDKEKDGEKKKKDKKKDKDESGDVETKPDPS